MIDVLEAVVSSECFTDWVEGHGEVLDAAAAAGTDEISAADTIPLVDA